MLRESCRSDCCECLCRVREWAADLFDATGLNVALERFFVVLVGAMHEAVDVPDDVGAQIVADSPLDEFVALRFPVDVGEKKSLHRERLCES